jgi:hypothetical protein
MVRLPRSYSHFLINISLLGVHIRVYFQRVDGFIYEAAWDDATGWNSGNAKLFQAKTGTPLTAIIFAVNEPQIRLYYLDNTNTIQEFAFTGTSWVKGATLPGAAASARTSLAAVTWDSAPDIRLYYQLQDNTIQELAFTSNTWVVGGHFASTQTFPGSALTATLINPSPSFRVYYQATDISLHELSWTGEWSDGRLDVFPPAQAPLSAVSWLDSSETEAFIRIYFPDSAGDFQELSFNSPSGWVIPPAVPINGLTGFTTPLSAVEWGSGPVNIRVFSLATNENNFSQLAWNTSAWNLGGLGF